MQHENMFYKIRIKKKEGRIYMHKKERNKMSCDVFHEENNDILKRSNKKTNIKTLE